MGNKSDLGTVINPSDGSWSTRIMQSIHSGYTVWKDGTTYRAESNVKGGTDYSSADAATTIQAAVDALAVTGGTIFLRAANYPISTRITLASNIDFIGESWGAVLTEADGADLLGVLYGDDLSNIRIANLQIDGNGDNQTSADGQCCCIVMEGQKINQTVENCYLHDGRAGNLHMREGGAGTQGYGIRVLNNTIGKSWLAADSTDNLWVSQAYDVLIQGNSVSESGYSGIIGGSGGDHDIRIIGNYVNVSGTKAGIFNDGNVVNDVYSVVISDNNIVGSGTGNGIELGDYVTQTSVTNNSVTGCLNGIRILNSESVTIRGNAIKDNQRFGIELANSDKCVINGNILTDNGQESATYCDLDLNTAATAITITGNTFTQTASDRYAILVDVGTTVSHVTISGNVVNLALEGIRILSGSHYAIVGNTVMDCARPGIHVDVPSLISGNFVVGCGAVIVHSGITLDANATGSVIIGNVCTLNSDRGIDLNSSDDNVVVGNDLRGNLVGTYVDNAANDIIEHNNEA